MANAIRIAHDRWSQLGLKGCYWACRKLSDQVVPLIQSNNRVFRRIVVRDLSQYLFDTVRPVKGTSWRRARAAAEWLLRAQDAAADGGVSYGFFPCTTQSGWKPAYPETTGYIIPSLLEFADKERSREFTERALRMAEWEISIQMPSGAVQGGVVCHPERQSPVAFNTGMVLHGWTAAYRVSGDKSFLEAGRRAADFLASDLSCEGYFQTNGTFVEQTGIKTYNCLCAWALYRFGQDVSEERYCKAATKVIEAALRQQQPNGWFANNCLSRPEAPLSHTIGYTLQGVLEVGILSKRTEFIEAVKRSLWPLLGCLLEKGFLSGRFYNDWSPASFSSCLTGSAQIAVVCYRLYEQTAAHEYQIVADRIVNFLKGLQVIGSPLQGVNGALAGSFPILGEYQTGGYPNWATKYFLDALILQHRLSPAS